MLERINPSKVGLCEERLERVTDWLDQQIDCLLYTSPSPRDVRSSRMPSSA